MTRKGFPQYFQIVVAKDEESAIRMFSHRDEFRKMIVNDANVVIIDFDVCILCDVLEFVPEAKLMAWEHPHRRTIESITDKEWENIFVTAFKSEIASFEINKYNTIGVEN